jgi:RHS repeat-associated protein
VTALAYNIDGNTNGSTDIIIPEFIDPLDPVKRSLGEKQYELSNHLGNVLVTVSDRKLAEGTEGSTATGYRAEVLFASDYYPFGMQMPGREFSAEEYRYGFQGQETDKEWLDGAVSYKYRVHDARIGRFLSVDPLAQSYPHNSPYAFSENRVVDGVELEGLEFVPVDEIWDLDGTAVSTSIYLADHVEYDVIHSTVEIHSQLVTLHRITDGVNKGNYIGIVHYNGSGDDFLCYKEGEHEAVPDRYMYEIRYVVGAERAIGGDLGSVAVDGVASIWFNSDNETPLEHSWDLKIVTNTNYYGYGHWDNDGNYIEDQSGVEGWARIVFNPVEYMPGPNVNIKWLSKGWNRFQRGTKGTYTKENFSDLTSKEIMDIKLGDYKQWVHKQYKLEGDIIVPESTDSSGK